MVANIYATQRLRKYFYDFFLKPEINSSKVLSVLEKISVGANSLLCRNVEIKAVYRSYLEHAAIAGIPMFASTHELVQLPSQKIGSILIIVWGINVISCEME